MARQLSAQSVALIHTELRTGRTFASLALCSLDPNKTSRNTANARKAYDSARTWAAKGLLAVADSKEIACQLELLKADLEKLEKRP